MSQPVMTAKTGNSQPPPVPPKRRRWPRVFGIGLVWLLVLLAFAPQLISWSTWRHELPRFRLPGFTDEIRVGRASLSWWGPIELWDIELDAPDGKPFVKIGHVREDRSVWQLVFHPTEPFHLRFERLDVNVLLRPDGDNVRDALAPVLSHPKRRRRERTVDVVDSRLHVIDTTTNRSVEWKNIALKMASEPDGTQPNRLRLSAELADAPGAEPLTADFTWSSAGPKSQGAEGAWKGVVQTRNLPLRAFGPLLSQVSADLDLSGSVSTDLHLQAGGDDESSGHDGLAGDCQIATKGVQLIWPSRLGDDHPALDAARLHIKFASDGERCRVEKLALVTDVCRLDGSGGIPLATGARAGKEHGGAVLEEANFKMRGALDLVALARMLPRTLPMRDGAELTEGQVKFALSSLAQDDRTGWSGRIETTRLAGEVAGEQIVWDRPLTVTFDLHEVEGQLQLDALECLSDVVRITGRANGAGGHFEAGCDLSRLAARLGQFFDTNTQQMRGELTAAVDLSRDADGALLVEARGDVANLLIRRQERRMVERRRGEIQPVEFEAPAGPPPLAPEQMADRKAAAARKRAEREAQRETRRREREARRQAEEIVMVPVEQWKTFWSESRLTVTGRGRYVNDKNLLELPELGVDSDGIRVQARGRLSEIFSRWLIDLDGESAIDMARLVERLRDTVGPHVQFTGMEKRRFSIHGPLRNPVVAAAPAAVVPVEMKGAASLGWKSGDLFGLQAGAADVDLALADGVVTLRPVDLDVSGGKLKLAGRALFNDGPARVVLPAGPIIENVELTEEVCDTWMKFIAPIMSQATRTEGRFSVELDETQVPFSDPATANLSGRLLIAKGQVLPGPLFTEISGLVGKIVAAASGNSPRDLLGLDTPLVRMNRQEVQFKLQDRRVFHNPVEFNVRNVVIRTRGSVGVDQSLDIVAEVSFSEELLSRARFLSQFRERPLMLPIHGTLRHPKVDPEAVGRFAAEFGQNAVEGIINRGLKNLLDRNP